MSIRYRRCIPGFARSAFGGKHRLTRRFDSKVAGELWLSSINDRIKAIKIGADLARVGVLKATTFSLAAGGWVAQLEVRPSTLSWYRSYVNNRLLPALGTFKTSQIDKTVLDQYKAKRRTTKNRFGKITSDRTLKAELEVALSILRWAKESGYQVDDSVFRVEKPNPVPNSQRRFNPEEVEALRETASRGPNPNPVKGGMKRPQALAKVAQRDLLAVEIMSRAGLRAGELRAMRVNWIRWDERRIIVPHDKVYSPKGAATRSIPLEMKLLVLLRSWIGDRTDGRVFEPQRRGRPRGKGSFRGIGLDVDKLMDRLSSESGLTLTAHDLRHHAISRWVDLMPSGNWSLVDVQKWAGHVSIRTTELYLHQAGERWRSHAESMDRAVIGTGLGQARSTSPNDQPPETIRGPSIQLDPKIGNQNVHPRKRRL